MPDNTPHRETTMTATEISRRHLNTDSGENSPSPDDVRIWEDDEPEDEGTDEEAVETLLSDAL